MFTFRVNQPMPKSDPTKNQLCIIGESDHFLSRLLQRFAEKSGFNIQPAQTGEDVLALAQQNKPALIILEPELPGKVRGWEAAQLLAAKSPRRRPSVIICSWMKKDEAQALIGEMSAYLQKPDLRYEDFVEALKTVSKPRVNRKKRSGITPAGKAVSG
jgi:DNA-binding response OmpR family regulator